MNVLIIDAQGGGIGKQLVSAIKAACSDVIVTAVGANSAATAAMLKAGADSAATGENAVIVCCRKADVIIGPIGIVIADSMLGEITPAMTVAIGQSSAKRILIPVNHCDNIVVGVPDLSVGKLIQNVIEKIKEFQT
jgi:prephenate dehydrogenase